MGTIWYILYLAGSSCGVTCLLLASRFGFVDSVEFLEET